MHKTHTRHQARSWRVRTSSLNSLPAPLHRNVQKLTIAWVAIWSASLGCTTQSTGHRAQRQAYHSYAVADLAPQLLPTSPQNALPLMSTWNTEELVEQVLSKNPSIDAARHAWKAAIGRIDGSRRIPDPQLSVALAPLSVVDPNTNVGQTWRIEQSFPLPSLLDARNQGAVARAQQDEAVFKQLRMELAHQARYLWIERWEIVQSLALLDHHESRFEELKRSVSAALETGKASLQDPLRIERNIAETERERGKLMHRKQILEARINGLLHRQPTQPLPEATILPVPDRWSPEHMFPNDLTQHPVVMWFSASETEALAAENVARAEFLPQLAWSAQYSTMFMQPNHQWMLGAGIQLPLAWTERTAKLDAALSTRERRRHESIQAQDQISVALHSAKLKGEEAWLRWRLYDMRLIPTTKAEAAAARTGFETGRASFQDWVRAENELQSMELAQAQAQADLHRATADVLFAAGQTDLEKFPTSNETTSSSIEETAP